MSSGSLLGSLTTTVDPVTGVATFSDLSLAMHSRYHLSFHVTSSPPQYDFTVVTDYIDVYPVGHQNSNVATLKTASLRFLADYDVVVLDQELYFSSVVFNYMSPKYTTTLGNFRITKGETL